MIRTIYGILGAVAVTAAAFAFPAQAAPGDNEPIAPFRIADDFFYVGASDIASYLIRTKAGLIVIDGGYDTTAPQILKNIRTLGFDPKQVKILLNTHAHLDHAGGLAQLKRETGATLYAAPFDAELMARGGKGDFALGDRASYPPVTPDRVLRDKQKVTLGDVTLTANLTPGHTRGCTTWTFPVQDSGGLRKRTLQVLLLCSNSVLPMYRLAGKESYPGIAADYEKSYRFWRSAPCEIFLASHAQFFRMREKFTDILVADGNRFDDPAGCKAFFHKGYAAFQTELAKQQTAAR